MTYVCKVQCVCDECQHEEEFESKEEAIHNGWTFIGKYCVCENCQDSIGDYAQMDAEESLDDYLSSLE